MSSSMDERVRENRLRRVAERQRLTLTKSRRRDPRAWDYGRFWLHDHQGNRVCPEGGLTIDQVERQLFQAPDAKKGESLDEVDEERLVGTLAG